MIDEPLIFEYPYQTLNEDNSNEIFCVIRTNSKLFKRDSINLQLLSRISFPYEANDELISKLVHIKLRDRLIFERAKIYLAMPHYINKSTLQTKEPIVKVLLKENTWKELKSSEIAVKSQKDFKFLQIELKETGIYAVVASLKRDRLVFTKRGGKVTSTLDSRLTFSCNPNTFRENEHFTVAIQMVDRF